MWRRGGGTGGLEVGGAENCGTGVGLGSESAAKDFEFLK